jgi:hypothetical protein
MLDGLRYVQTEMYECTRTYVGKKRRAKCGFHVQRSFSNAVPDTESLLLIG